MPLLDMTPAGHDADDRAHGANRMRSFIERIPQQEAADAKAEQCADEQANLVIGLQPVGNEIQHGSIIWRDWLRPREFAACF
jgi:hypothetical protein